MFCKYPEKMASLFWVISFCVFTTALATPLASPSIKQQEILSRVEKSDDFKTIGQIGSKVFIMHKNPNANWMQGLSFCKKAGLEHAKVENCEEFDYVYHNTERKTELWISGIMRGALDSQTNAFAWHKDGKDLPVDGVNLYIPSERWYCLYLGGDHHSYIDFCLKGQHQTLCQLQLS